MTMTDAEKLREDLVGRILELARRGPTRTLRLDEDAWDDYKERNPDAHGDYVEHEDVWLVEEDAKKPYPKRIAVHIGVLDSTRHYGGPEEGGWWYNDYVPVETEVIRLRFENDEPVIDENEEKVLLEISSAWVESYEFGTNYQSSVRPKDSDYYLSVGWEKAIEHSSRPGSYC